MKISFDFDSTLATIKIQKLAKKFIDCGNEVWIITTRTRFPKPTADWNNDSLFDIAKKLGISEERIMFTEYKPIWRFVEGFDIHFDDDEFEVDFINEQEISCVGVLIK